MSSELARVVKVLPRDPGHRIRVAMAFHNRKNNDLARAIGADVTKVSRALNGYRAFSEDEQTRVAEFLELPVDLLFPTSERIAS